MGRPGSFDYRRCERCGLVQLHPIPANLSDYYEAYQVHQRKSEIHNWIRLQLMSGGYFSPRARPTGLKILDYGCGDGWFVQSMIEQGHNAAGFEPNEQYAHTLSDVIGAPVYSGRQLQDEAQQGAFDAVTMHFVMEHVTDIGGTFEMARSLLKPGGTFYFLIPNIDSTEFRLFKKLWHGLDAPRHTNFLTEPLVREISARHGFSFENCRRLSLPNGFAGSLSTALAGHYSHALFLALIPLATAYCLVAPDGNLAFSLRRNCD